MPKIALHALHRHGITDSLYEECVVSQSEGRKEGGIIYLHLLRPPDRFRLLYHHITHSSSLSLDSPWYLGTEHQLVAPKATEYMIACSIQFASEINIPRLSLTL